MAEDIVKPEETLEINMNEGEVRGEVATDVFGDEFTNEENIAFLKRQVIELQSASTGISFANGISTVTADGDTEITCGFEPSMIKVTAWYGQADAGYSTGTATGIATADNSYFIRYYDGTNWYNTTGTSYIVSAPDATGSTRINGVVSAISSTSFTITWTNYISGTINYTWEAYK